MWILVRAVDPSTACAGDVRMMGGGRDKVCWLKTRNPSAAKLLTKRPSIGLISGLSQQYAGIQLLSLIQPATPPPAPAVQVQVSCNDILRSIAGGWPGVCATVALCKGGLLQVPNLLADSPALTSPQVDKATAAQTLPPATPSPAGLEVAPATTGAVDTSGRRHCKHLVLNTAHVRCCLQVYHRSPKSITCAGTLHGRHPR
jgi:hypothetical protein